MTDETQAIREAFAVYATEAPEAAHVPRGYRQTEVGLIPQDWEVRNLGDLGSVVRGASPRPAGDPKFFNGDYIPWLTVAALTNVPDSQIEVTETFGSLTEEGARQSRVLENGTLIVANSGATLGVAKILMLECCANDGIAAIIDQRSGDKRFICYFVNSRTSYLRHIVATGNGQPNLNTSLVGSIPTPYPPISEQRAIADALSDVDALTSSLDRLILKKRAVKTAAMQELLTGKQRLPGFSGEWETRQLGEVCQIISGGTPSTSVPVFWAGNIPWCTPTDITENDTKYLFTTNRTISEDGLKHSSAVLLPRGALLLCTRATVGEIKIAAVPVCTNQGFKSLVCHPAASNEFLYYKMVTLKEKLRERGVGSTFLEVSRKDIAALEVPLPTLKEQTAIATVLSDMDAEISALDARREKTRQIKQGMMQELLTGRTRLV